MAPLPLSTLIPAAGAFALAPGTLLAGPTSPNRLALIRGETDPRRPLSYNSEVSILFSRASESRSVVGDPVGSPSTDTLQAKELIPLQAGAPYLDQRRSFFVRDLPETSLEPVFCRALALTEPYEATASRPTNPSPSAYRGSDTSQPLFNEVAELALPSASNSARMESMVGLVI